MVALHSPRHRPSGGGAATARGRARCAGAAVRRSGRALPGAGGRRSPAPGALGRAHHPRRTDVRAGTSGPSAALTRRDVIAMVEDIDARGAPVYAAACFAQARALFGWCVARDLLEHSPCTNIKLAAFVSRLKAGEATHARSTPKCERCGRRPANWRSRGRGHFACCCYAGCARPKRWAQSGPNFGPR